jgi:DNA-directed RNA polymerase
MIDEIKQKLSIAKVELKTEQAALRSLVAVRDNAKRAAKTAVMFRGTPFYFRIGMDFRGRMYYKGAHLNPQMGDDIKSTLVLANKKPLGADGYKWLLWGVASSAGFDKADFQTRVNYTLDNLFEIKEAVANPNESEFFKKVHSDGEPALFLQRAGELVKAVESGSIQTYETDITIAMDATCSGLQLLSAVARDAEGGSLVNITATAEGQTEKRDVYSKVCQLILEKYADLPDNFFAQWITQHGLPRRFTKKVVMTLPYSATVRGAISYVQEELYGNPEKGALPYDLPTEPADRLSLLMAARALAHIDRVDEDISTDSLYYVMATVLARDMHETCYKILPAAMKLLEFFKSTPSHLFDHAIWNTPDGLHVKQLYGVKENFDFHYKFMHTDPSTGEIQPMVVRRNYNYLDPSEKNRSKAANGMPPNWVHSLDATLVRRVVLKAPFDIVCIHDSFAAHPSDCNKLASILREEFVWLIEQDPLGTLIKQLNDQVGAQVFSTEGLMVNTLKTDDPLRSEFLFC